MRQIFLRARRATINVYTLDVCGLRAIPATQPGSDQFSQRHQRADIAEGLGEAPDREALVVALPAAVVIDGVDGEP